MILVLAVVLICTFMAAITYGLGVLPLHLDIKHHLKLISLFSGGLLVGAALCLAIPESIESYNENAGNDSKWIGISIMLGFVCMLLVEQLHQELEVDVEDFGPITQSSKLKSLYLTPLTLALLIHSAIDGISLGSGFHNESITLVLSLVVIIHKLPTCFSLGCLLVQKGMALDMVRFHVIVFSLTTPVFAFLTWLVLLATLSNSTVIGVLLLFSSGTFLYILTNILGEFHELSKSELGVMLVGIIIPGCLSLMH